MPPPLLGNALCWGSGGSDAVAPPPPKVRRVLESPHSAPVLRALRNQLQEKDALIRHLEVRGGLGRGGAGGGRTLLNPPPPPILVVAQPE